MNRRRRRPKSRLNPNLNEGPRPHRSLLYGALFHDQALEHQRQTGKIPLSGCPIRIRPQLHSRNPERAFAESRSAVINQIVDRARSRAVGIMALDVTGRPVRKMDFGMGMGEGWWYVGGGPASATVLEIRMHEPSSKMGQVIPFTGTQMGTYESDPMSIQHDFEISGASFHGIQSGHVHYVWTTKPAGQIGDVIRLTYGNKTLIVEQRASSVTFDSLLELFHPTFGHKRQTAYRNSWQTSNIWELSKGTGFRNIFCTQVLNPALTQPHINALKPVDPQQKPCRTTA